MILACAIVLAFTFSVSAMAMSIATARTMGAFQADLDHNP
jgi:hypothetical protein